MNRIQKKLLNVFERIKQDDLNYFEEQFLYGHREILLNYIMVNGHKISEQSYLQGGLAHGWAPNYEVWKLRKRNLMPAHRYIWKDSVFVPNSSKYNQIPIGAPWLYLLLSLKITSGIRAELPVVGKRENLVIPYHSLGTNLKKINQQAAHFKKFIDPKKSTVCLFWLDFCDQQNRKAYKDLGFEVECVGYSHRVHNSYLIGNPRTFFLINLLTLMLEHRNVITDSISTPVFYAGSLGKNIVIAENQIAKEYSESFDSIIQKIAKEDVGSSTEWLRRNNLFQNPSNENLFLLNFKCWEELGLNYLKNPLELSDLDWKVNMGIPNHVFKFRNKLLETKKKISFNRLN